MNEAVIFEVIKKPKNARSTCLQFQNGELLEDHETALSCGLHSNDANRIIPVLASDTLIYTGHVAEQNAYNTFLAIRSKRTNKMKLVAINEALLKPQPPKMREVMDSTMMDTNKRAVTDLNKEFGSKRTKRQTETLERLKVNVDNFKDQLEKTVANISVEDMEVDDVPQTSEVLPYINRDAELTADVYTLNMLIPNSVMASLEQASEQLMEAEEDKITTTNESIKKQILAWQGSSDEKAQEIVAMLLVLDALMTHYFSSVKSITMKGYEPSRFSQALNSFILDNFTVRSGKFIQRPLALKDKTCCYIIVLTLLLNQNKLNLDEFGREMKLSAKKLNDLCSMLLLHVKDKRAFVKLPLPSPRVFTSKKKGRK